MDEQHQTPEVRASRISSRAARQDRHPGDAGARIRSLQQAPGNAVKIRISESGCTGGCSRRCPDTAANKTQATTGASSRAGPRGRADSDAAHGNSAPLGFRWPARARGCTSSRSRSCSVRVWREPSHELQAQTTGGESKRQGKGPLVARRNLRAAWRL